jgi:hypothetical protein
MRFMRHSQRQSRRIRLDAAAWPIPALVDRVLDMYVDWRETTNSVANTYRWWCLAPAVEEAARFAAYLAALDQEQTAAGVYAESITELERWLWGSDPARGSGPRAALA